MSRAHPRTLRCRLFGCRFRGIGYFINFLFFDVEIEACSRCGRGRIERFTTEYYTPEAVRQHIAIVESQKDPATNNIIPIFGR